MRHVGRAREAAEPAAEVGHRGGGVERGEGRDLDGFGVGCLVIVREFVLEDPGDGGVVEGALAGEVRAGGHVERGCGRASLGLEQDVGGLPGRDHYYVGLEWLHVHCVCFHHGERVVGDFEEEFVVERSVDHSEKVRLPWPHPQFECLCDKNKNYKNRF